MLLLKPVDRIAERLIDDRLFLAFQKIETDPLGFPFLRFDDPSGVVRIDISWRTARVTNALRIACFWRRFGLVAWQFLREFF